MSYKILFTDHYNKKARLFLKKHPQMLRQYQKTLALLEMNPFHPSLRLHKLDGKLKNLHSVAINLSYRITLELLIDNEEIIPVNVGDHITVYGKN